MATGTIEEHLVERLEPEVPGDLGREVPVVQRRGVGLTELQPHPGHQLFAARPDRVEAFTDKGRRPGFDVQRHRGERRGQRGPELGRRHPHIGKQLRPVRRHRAAPGVEPEAPILTQHRIASGPHPISTRRPRSPSREHRAGHAGR